ncbi:hypothetical protein [uncultured Amnibacterium sp.]|uniref:hypothetical protein n=1 Tax=uncultured Amnibacterium sp. TaxID=1631851 RepID=UPI0035C94C0B
MAFQFEGRIEPYASGVTNLYRIVTNERRSIPGWPDEDGYDDRQAADRALERCKELSNAADPA